MPWHSTGSREELVIVLDGTLRFEHRRTVNRLNALLVRAGQCVFVPASTLHQVINRSRAVARYLYVTAPAGRR
jgi:mannose-6-phosphate isomerase-like protein (cupin superfamily)